MSTYKFVTPTFKAEPRFLGTYGMSTGVTVVKIGSAFRDVLVPDQDYLDSCDAYWRGGYEHYVDEATGLALIAAGYNVEVTGAYGFGVGPFGEGPFGGNA